MKNKKRERKFKKAQLAPIMLLVLIGIILISAAVLSEIFSASFKNWFDILKLNKETFINSFLLYNTS